MSRSVVSVDGPALFKWLMRSAVVERRVNIRQIAPSLRVVCQTLGRMQMPMPGERPKARQIGGPIRRVRRYELCDSSHQRHERLLSEMMLLEPGDERVIVSVIDPQHFDFAILAGIENVFMPEVDR